MNPTGGFLPIFPADLIHAERVRNGVKSNLHREMILNFSYIVPIKDDETTPLYSLVCSFTGYKLISNRIEVVRMYVCVNSSIYRTSCRLPIVKKIIIHIFTLLEDINFIAS